MFKEHKLLCGSTNGRFLLRDKLFLVVGLKLVFSYAGKCHLGIASVELAIAA